jgi:hypothetical protein
MKWLFSIFDRLFVVAGALAFSQAPLFMLQYTHQLSGHVVELQYQVNKLEAAAGESGKSLSEYIHKFESNPDPDFARQGKNMQGMVERSQSFNQAYNALNSSSLLGKPFVFVAYINQEVAIATWKAFEYGLAFSAEGLSYAFIGGMIGYSVYALIVLTIKSIVKVLSFRKTAPVP